jgi:hypothetical protein
MTEKTEPEGYEALARSFRDSLGPLEMLADFVEDGLELEAWGATKTGRLLLTRARSAARVSIEVLLRPNSTDDEIARALMELRVQHRVMQAYSDVVQMGRDAQRRILEAENQEEGT